MTSRPGPGLVARPDFVRVCLCVYNVCVCVCLSPGAGGAEITRGGRTDNLQHGPKQQY